MHIDPKQMTIFLLISGMIITLACSITIEPSKDRDGQTKDDPESPIVAELSSCMDGITPGQTSRQDVIALLGEPASTDLQGESENLFYPTSAAGQFNTIVIENQRVSYISVVLGEDSRPSLSIIQTKYGEPQHNAYCTYMQGCEVFAYPQHGLLLIADPVMDIVFIQDCFLPTMLDEYMRLYGSHFPVEDPYIR